MSANLQTVCIVKVPGVNERKAIALARARVEMTGLTPADDLAPTVELVESADDGSAAWQISIPIQESEQPS